MTGAPVRCDLRPTGASSFLQIAVDAADDFPGALGLHELAVERDDGQRQLPVRRQELALDDVVGPHRLDDLVVLGAVGQLVGHDRRRIAVRVRLAAGREHGDQPVHAVGELQVDDGAAEGFELRLLEEVLALDDDQHVVLAGGKAAVDLLVAPELLGVGAEELGKRVVDPEQRQAPARQDGQRDDQQKRDGRRPQPDQTQPLQSEREGPSRRVHTGVHHPPGGMLAASFLFGGHGGLPAVAAQAHPGCASVAKSLPGLCFG